MNSLSRPRPVMKQLSCLAAGSMPMDIVQKKEPDRSLRRLYVHVGGTPGNVATMLAAQFGWRALPLARFDGSGWGRRLVEDLERYGADTRFVSAEGDGGTTLFVETHGVDKAGNPRISYRPQTPRGGPFTSYRHLPRKEVPAFLNRLGGDRPDVFFYDQPAAGLRALAEELHSLGTLVFFEPPTRCDPKDRAKALASADVVKVSSEAYGDAPFLEGLSDKLVVRTMNKEGLAFNLRGAGWRTLKPVPNPDFVDGEGAGDWTSSALLAALGRRGLPRTAELDEATVADCLREAQETASRSTSFLGSKGMLEDRFPAPAEWLDASRDPAPPPAPPPGPKKEKKPRPGFEDMVFAPDPVAEKKGWTVFLAGPIGGAPKWQESVPGLARRLGIEGVTWLNPRGRHVPHRPQVEWETQGLRLCDYVLFWIPEQAEPAAKPYALTTRMELAENLARGKRVVLGIAPGKAVPWMRHARFLAERYGVRKVRASLEECLLELKRQLARRKPEERTVDGPAFVEETLRRHPACVDELARNQLLVEQWNHDVAPDDVVRVRGEFVDRSLLPLLNGDIRFE